MVIELKVFRFVNHQGGSFILFIVFLVLIKEGGQSSRVTVREGSTENWF